MGVCIIESIQGFVMETVVKAPYKIAARLPQSNRKLLMMEVKRRSPTKKGLKTCQ